MFWISSKLTLVMLCVVPPISIGAVFYGRYLRKLSNLTQEAIGDMSKVRLQVFCIYTQLYPPGFDCQYSVMQEDCSPD